MSSKQQHEQMSLEENLEQLQTDLNIYIKEIHNITELLNNIAKELDETFKSINIAKVTGASTAIAGGILSAVGFGLSFFTFGASLALTVAGGVICGAGGLTVGGAEIANLVKSSKAMKGANKNIKKYNDQMKIVRDRCLEIGAKLERYGEIDKTFTSWVEFWAKLTGAGINVGWSAIGRTIGVGVNITNNATRVTTSTGVTLVKSLGTGVGRGIHIAGGVAGVLLMPLDIYTLVDSAIDLHKENPHEISKKIREVADGMIQKCPCENEIHNMIEAVSIALHGQDDVRYEQPNPLLSPNQMLHAGWNFVVSSFCLTSFYFRNVLYNCNFTAIILVIVVVVLVIGVVIG